MRQQTVAEYAIMVLATLTSLAWLGLLPPGQWIGQAMLLLLAWSAVSTFLVAVVAGWIALSRRRRRWDGPGT